MGRLIYNLVFIFTCLLNVYAGGWAIGINYGLLGDNLPPPAVVVQTLKQRNIPKTRLFDPNQDILTALHDSGVSVIVGTRNEDLQSLATDPAVATSWVETNILPHHASVDITYVAAGNEVYPGEFAQYIPDAIQNLDSALTTAGLSIPVTTAVSMQVLSISYPPSQGTFQADAVDIMSRIARFLSSKNNSPLLVNVYPYFARVGDPAHVELSYALFLAGAPIIHDGQLAYHNIFDAMVDAVYSALEKVGAPNVEVVVTETGWPTDGGMDTSVENASTYVNNLIQHVSSGKGTPKRPGKAIETYIFAMFNEDLKPQGVEQHWGLYYPNLTEVYHANL